MQFHLPQFIEHEAKVIGPLTFRQTAFIGAPIPFLFFIYFMLPNKLFIFLLVAIALEGIGAILAFVKIGAKTAPQLIVDAFYFLTRPKTYVWQRGKVNVRSDDMEYANDTKSASTVGLSKKSQVQDLAVKVQTRK